MDTIIFGFALVLILSFISRIISQNATSKLDSDKKALLIDLFSKNGLFSSGIVLALALLLFANIKFNWLASSIAYIIYFSLVFIYFVVFAYKSYEKLKINGFPLAFINSYLLATIIRLLGLVLFFIFI